jgi:hypothetical protein
MAACSVRGPAAPLARGVASGFCPCAAQDGQLEASLEVRDTTVALKSARHSVQVHQINAVELAGIVSGVKCVSSRLCTACHSLAATGLAAASVAGTFAFGPLAPATNAQRGQPISLAGLSLSTNRCCHDQSQSPHFHHAGRTDFTSALASSISGAKPDLSASNCRSTASAWLVVVEANRKAVWCAAVTIAEVNEATGREAVGGPRLRRQPAHGRTKLSMLTLRLQGINTV